MELKLEGKVALVAAASKGIGKAIAMGLAREGARLSICARHKTTLLKTESEIRIATGAEIISIVADVTKTGDIGKFVSQSLKRYERIDILVTNAGGPPPGKFLDFSDDDWYDAVTLNLMSTIRLIREVVPYMRKQGGGRIINLVSIAAKQPINGLILSNTARAGVLGLAKTLANELAKDDILINNICPGWIYTDRAKEVISKQAKASNISEDSVLSEIVSQCPLGRYGKPEEVANLVVFLASECASYITGTTIQVDGGASKGLI